MSKPEDFVEIGRQAFRDGKPAAPTLNLKVRRALAGLPVGSEEGLKVMKDFSDGWTQASRPEAIATEIRHTQWLLDTFFPAEIKATNHARRLASLKRQRDEAEQKLSRLVTDLGAVLQERQG